ncbi:MAG TPA: ribosome maturation factor RimM [Polyangia bacterium]|nr:ribosome maturation factor RimM [Polyangia bacterium]
MSHASYDPETLLVGVMGRPHGLRGELSLRAHNRDSADLARVPELILERPNGREERRIEGIRRSPEGWLVKLAGVDSRTDAEPLTNAAVRVRRARLPAPMPGEFFVQDAVGCEVFAADDRRLGTVAGLMWNGAQDILIVEGESEILIPALPEFVRSIDLAKRRIDVTWEEDDG